MGSDVPYIAACVCVGVGGGVGDMKCSHADMSRHTMVATFHFMNICGFHK